MTTLTVGDICYSILTPNHLVQYRVVSAHYGSNGNYYMMQSTDGTMTHLVPLSQVEREYYTEQEIVDAICFAYTDVEEGK